MNPTKIVEAVIIGAISAICAYVFTIPKLEQKIENMNTNMLEMKGQMSEMRHDFYAPIHKSADVPTKHDGNHNGS